MYLPWVPEVIFFFFFFLRAKRASNAAKPRQRVAKRQEKKKPLVACIVNLIFMQISYHISHQTGFSLGGQACVYTASVCFHYVTVYVTYDRTWRIDASLGAIIYLYFFASEASEKRATPHQQKITL